MICVVLGAIISIFYFLTHSTFIFHCYNLFASGYEEYGDEKKRGYAYFVHGLTKAQFGIASTQYQMLPPAQTWLVGWLVATANNYNKTLVLTVMQNQT